MEDDEDDEDIVGDAAQKVMDTADHDVVQALFDACVKAGGGNVSNATGLVFCASVLGQSLTKIPQEEWHSVMRVFLRMVATYNQSEEGGTC